MTARPLLHWITGALAALALGACTNQAEPSAEPGGTILIKKLTPDEAGNAAAGTGTLILRDGCLAMEHGDRSRTLLLWPAEARLERSADGAMRVLGTEGTAQHTVRVGEEIIVGGSELGGGETDSARVGPGREIAATAAYPAGCTGRVWNIYSFEPAPTIVGPAMADVATMKGDWAVAKIFRAAPLPGTTVIKVAITDDRIRAQSQCVPFWWTYKATPQSFAAEREPYPDAVCERTQSPWEKAFGEAVDRASSAVLEQDGSLLITGPGGEVLLRRQ